ncbi:uncharacterized protein C8Q71DRAFT_340310 [Rhodofomes roseus]|uniref:F-box domain-containing protein n=1 Tax=Rhodofomes roseus TaxID=34475 RepID=A0ABQ8KS27_9APHY|nr:uncharacterized protein C8Q71DRAFT_340310 [Rhodofomes roseus]KAH9841611.1 hypothetical protein C8Q71DRAFT_340310 [Rhodofomes roseus]
MSSTGYRTVELILLQRHCFSDVPRAINTSILPDDVLQLVFDFLAEERVYYGRNLNFQVANDVIPQVCGSWNPSRGSRSPGHRFGGRSSYMNTAVRVKSATGWIYRTVIEGVQVEFTRMHGAVEWGLHLSELRLFIHLAEILCKHAGRFEEFTILHFDAEALMA